MQMATPLSIIGIDLGSREVKVAVMRDGQIIEKKKYSTVAFYRNHCSYSGHIKVNLESLGYKDSDFAIRVSTGYGRNNTDLEQFVAINEIKAHVYGAVMQTGERDFVLLDVGGQDVKVVKVEGGLAKDLDLNDKCAASCGRYLENMATVLETDLDVVSSHHENPVQLSSTCAVFAESELIGKIAEGVALPELCAGVNYSMYRRLSPMLTRYKHKRLLVSGGVAKNRAIITYLKQDFNDVAVLPDPQFNGAIGCCYYGARLHRSLEKEKEGMTCTD